MKCDTHQPMAFFGSSCWDALRILGQSYFGDDVQCSAFLFLFFEDISRQSAYSFLPLSLQISPRGGLKLEAANLNPLKLREKNKKEAIWGIFLLKCLSVRKQTKIKGTKIRGSGDSRLTKIAGNKVCLNRNYTLVPAACTANSGRRDRDVSLRTHFSMIFSSSYNPYMALVDLRNRFRYICINWTPDSWITRQRRS